MVIIAIEIRVAIIVLYFKNSKSPKQVLRKLRMQYEKKETLSETLIRRIINQFLCTANAAPMENDAVRENQERKFLFFILCDFLKDNVYRKAFSDTDELKQVISNFISKIKIQTL